jgi:predicted GIY-YIG superfamily endonuclease
MKHYVYILRSVNDPKQVYIGYTRNLEERLTFHNSEGTYHTRKFQPWKIETYVVFSSEKLAIEFEKYLKVGSGKAFMRKRLIKAV